MKKLINKILMVNSSYDVINNDIGRFKITIRQNDNIVLHNMYCLKMFLIKHLNICRDIKIIINRFFVPRFNKYFDDV